MCLPSTFYLLPSTFHLPPLSGMNDAGDTGGTDDVEPEQPGQDVLLCDSIGCPDGFTQVPDAGTVECTDDPCSVDQCCVDGKSRHVAAVCAWCSCFSHGPLQTFHRHRTPQLCHMCARPRSFCRGSTIVQPRPRNPSSSLLTSSFRCVVSVALFVVPRW